MTNANSISSPRDQDRWLPIANVSRIMKLALPSSSKISKDAKESMQECVSEFISFITSEASEKCILEKRKTISGEDILSLLATLGFDNYAEVLKIYLTKFRFLMVGVEKGVKKNGIKKKKKLGLDNGDNLDNSETFNNGDFEQPDIHGFNPNNNNFVESTGNVETDFHTQVDTNFTDRGDIRDFLGDDGDIRVGQNSFSHGGNLGSEVDQGDIRDFNTDGHEIDDLSDEGDIRARVGHIREYGSEDRDVGDIRDFDAQNRDVGDIRNFDAQNRDVGDIRNFDADESEIPDLTSNPLNTTVSTSINTLPSENTRNNVSSKTDDYDSNTYQTTFSNGFIPRDQIHSQIHDHLSPLISLSPHDKIDNLPIQPEHDNLHHSHLHTHNLHPLDDINNIDPHTHSSSIPTEPFLFKQEQKEDYRYDDFIDDENEEVPLDELTYEL